MAPEDLAKRLAATSPQLRDALSLEGREAVVRLDPEQILPAAEQLKQAGFERLVMVTAVDYREYLELVYRVHSRSISASLVVKTRVAPDSARVASVCSVWPAANWQEREVFDLLGIEFEGHPDLRRILLPDEFDGHPLRKEYDDPRLIRRPDYI